VAINYDTLSLSYYSVKYWLVNLTVSSTVLFLASTLTNQNNRNELKDLLQANGLFKIRPQNELAFMQNELGRWGWLLWLASPTRSRAPAASSGRSVSEIADGERWRGKGSGPLSGRKCAGEAVRQGNLTVWIPAFAGMTWNMSRDVSCK
jgi:hypothetical protein